MQESVSGTEWVGELAVQRKSERIHASVDLGTQSSVSRYWIFKPYRSYRMAMPVRSL